jgi:ribosomal protein L7/L12
VELTGTTLFWLAIAAIVGFVFGRLSLNAGAGRTSEQRDADAEANLAKLSAAAREEVTRLALDRQKIAAIKAMRQDTGLGLKEAKEAVERLVRQGRNAT